MQGPPATQPAQQNATPTWIVGRPGIGPRHEAQVKAEAGSDRDMAGSGSGIQATHADGLRDATDGDGVGGLAGRDALALAERPPQPLARAGTTPWMSMNGA